MIQIFLCTINFPPIYCAIERKILFLLHFPSRHLLHLLFYSFLLASILLLYSFISYQEFTFFSFLLYFLYGCFSFVQFYSYFHFFLIYLFFSLPASLSCFSSLPPLFSNIFYCSFILYFVPHKALPSPPDSLIHLF